MFRVSIIGSGPTAIYTLRALLPSTVPLDIVIYEKTGTAGTGMPYRRGTNHPELLANIASVELPHVLEPLDKWLNDRSDAGLQGLGLDRDAITDRAFFPRVAVGHYYRDQLFRLAARAQTLGHMVTIKVDHDVIDVSRADIGWLVSGKANGKTPFKAGFDAVVVATGHAVDDQIDNASTYLDSPYPTSRLERLTGRVGILGTSLSAIDAAITIALRHGDFGDADGTLRYRAKPGAQPFEIAMMSRHGLIPEADFFCPIPFELLAIFTHEAVEAMISEGSDGLLDRAFSLFKAELRHSDPDYSDSIGLEVLSPEAFTERYFDPRLASDPFEWARTNLAEVTTNRERGFTVPWRYAILRMHEVMEAIVAHLSPIDRSRFGRSLKRVFVDNYAAIPPRSIERLLALHEAGVLHVIRLGEDYQHIEDRSMHCLRTIEGDHLFDALVDATSERPAKPDQMVFPGLRSVFLGGPDTHRALSVDGVYMASLPYLMADRPFIQGLVSCCEIGTEVAKQIRAGLGDTHPSHASLGDLIKSLIDDTDETLALGSETSNAITLAEPRIAVEPLHLSVVRQHDPSTASPTGSP